jgi:hypothetical protein
MKQATKPKRIMQPWLDFILAEGAIPAVVESKNNGGGLVAGQKYISWDFDGQYYAIRNQSGNAVWCHKKNLKLASIGTVDALSHRKDVGLTKDYMSMVSHTQKTYYRKSGQSWKLARGEA